MHVPMVDDALYWMKYTVKLLNTDHRLDGIQAVSLAGLLVHWPRPHNRWQVFHHFVQAGFIVSHENGILHPLLEL